MNVNIRIKFYLPLAFLACSGFALEQPENDLLLEQKQDTPQLHVGGHLSQSFLKTENNNYLHEDSMDGTFDMNEFALNVSGDLGKNVFLNSQLIVRNAMEDSGIDIDFANVDLHLNENTSLLIGKNKMPLGWFNQSLDSSHSNPFIVAPLGVYSPGFHETIVSAWGLGVDHSRALGKGYFLDAEMALGTSSIDSDSDFMRESKFQEEHLALSTSQAVINALGGPPTTVDRVSLQNYEAKIKQRLATRLVLRTPMNLKFGYSLGFDKVELDYQSHTTTTTLLTLAPGVTVPLTNTAVRSFNNEVKISPHHIFSMEYLVSKNIKLTSEYRLFSLDFLMNGPGVTFNQTYKEKGYYVMLHYRPKDKLGLNYSFSQLDSELLTAQGKREVDDHTITVQYDLSEKWMLRMESHFIKGLAPFFYMNPTGTKDSTQVYLSQVAFIF